MKTYFLFASITLLVNIGNVYAQDIQQSNSSNADFKFLKKGESDKWFYIENENITTHQLCTEFKKCFGLNDSDSLSITRIKKSDSSEIRYTIQQSVNGINVEGATAYFHTRNGYVYRVKQNFIPRMRITNSVQVNKSRLELIIKSFYPNDTIDYEKLLAKAELVLYKNFNDATNKSETMYSWKVSVILNDITKSHNSYIDAYTGEIIKTTPLVDLCSYGTGTTAHHGQKPIQTQFVDPILGYRLYDDCVHPYSTAKVHTMSNSFFNEYYDLTNNWVDPTAMAAVQTHWVGRQVLDYYGSYWGRNSYNNSGGDLILFNNPSPLSSLETYWEPTTHSIYLDVNDPILYTDNDNTIDIIGHEFTHGVDQFEGDLENSYEAGSLGESFSDIFGTAIERWVKGTVNWEIGEERGFTLRNLSNPNLSATPQPDTRYGTNWFDITTCISGYCGSHKNCGVQNYWFYLLVNGGNGTNDLPFSNNFNVTPIGFEDAIKIAYRNLTNELSGNDDYDDAREGAINAACYLFGPCSQQVCSVKQAWFAVGVGSNCTSAGSLPPTNDNCSGAILLTDYLNNCTNLTNGSIACATEDPSWNAPNCSYPSITQKDLFYKFIATSDNASISVIPDNNTYASLNAVVSLYIGSNCNILTQVPNGCVDNTIQGQNELLNVTGLTVGQTYWIRVYHWGVLPPQYGGFTICVTHTPITTSCIPPPTTTSISPGTLAIPGTSLTTLTPTFNWNTVTTSYVDYKLSISKSPYGLSNLVYSSCVGNPPFTLPSGYLINNENYRWDVQTNISCGTCQGGFSPDRYFSTSAMSGGIGQWTWKGGDSTSGSFGVYGSLGVANSSNKPGARSGSVSWVDNQDNLWMMGGYGNASITSGNLAGSLNDLWKYSVNSGLWTWMGGDNSVNQTSVYGILGIASSVNKPGARSGSVSWVDNQGNLWMMGGGGASFQQYFNDLWKYNVSTGLWTWMSGNNIPNQVGVYGALGISSITNKPGARSGAISWTDNSGNLWLFGGKGGNSFNNWLFNDLWKYNIVIGQWTWMGGNNTTNQIGVYGALNIPATTNKPGARVGAARWKDNTGNLWLFGGSGYSSSSSGDLNDLWKYNISNGEWTWIGGSNSIGQIGNYGVLGISSISNKPGARNGPLSWNDNNNNLYLMGGYGFGNVDYLNDLWRYNIGSGDWTWISGSSNDNQFGNYGMLNIPSITNVPGSRNGSISWKDNVGNLWLLGGNGFATSGIYPSILNDLWKYSFGPCSPITYSSNITTCGSYNWHGATYTSSGIYTYTYLNALGCIDTESIDLNILPQPSISITPLSPSICVGTSQTLSSSGATNYTWIPGSVSGSSITVAPLASTTYTVMGTSTNGCTKTATRTIIVNQPPNVTTSTNASSICVGASAILIANGASNYSWIPSSLTGTSINVSPTSNTTYTVTGSGANGCTKTATRTITVNQLPIVSASNATGCIGVPITLAGNPVGGSFSVPNPYTGNSTNYIYSYTNSFGCSATSFATITAIPCNSNLNLKLFFEGYYIGANTMAPTLMNQSVSLNNTVTDTIEVQLRNDFSPYGIIAITKTVINTNGAATCIFPPLSGYYYIVVKHRNGLETWSSLPVAIGSNPVNYDFSNAANKAYGSNQTQIDIGIWAFYSGDLNYDENIDLLDLSDLEFDINSFNFGYYATDLNGDGNVDLLDAPVMEANINNFIFSNHP